MIDEPNLKTCNLKLTRGEVCKLMILLSAAVEDNPERRTHLQAIRLKIKAQLAAHDEKRREKQS